MREYISYKDIANTVMMLRTSFKGTIAVVEGVTDRRLYGKFFDKGKAEIVIAHSKDNVRNSVKEVYQNRKMPSVIGIMDADLDLLYGKKREPPLFLTDTRDSENMMFTSDAYFDVLEELVEPDMLRRFELKYGNIRDRVMNAAYPIGILMYICSKNRFNLSFKDLDFEHFINRRDLSCNIDILIGDIIDGSEGQVPEETLLRSLYDSEASHPAEIVCRGHDIISIMALGLRNIFGGRNCRNISDAHLAGNFRLAYSEAYVRGTKLYSDTADWCSENGLSLWKIKD